MKVHIAGAPRKQSLDRRAARYANLGTALVATEQHEDPISLTDTTYRMIMNCQANSDSNGLTTNTDVNRPHCNLPTRKRR